MKTKKTVWSIFRDYVNSKPIGMEITRQEILNKIEKELFNAGKIIRRLDRGRVADFSPSTLDTARNMSEKVGYLGKTTRFGFYKVLNHFPPEYTVSQLRKDYNNGVNCNQ